MPQKKKMPLQFLVLHFLFFTISISEAQQSLCPSSSCGKIRNISYPFRLETDPKNCGGQKWHELSCENNATSPTLSLGPSIRYVVESINYNNNTLRIVDPGLREQDCSSLPRHSLTIYNFTYSSDYQRLVMSGFTYTLSNSVVFMSCENPADSSLFKDAAASSCARNDSERGRYFYAMVNESATVSDIPSSCRVEVITMMGSRMRNVNLSGVSFLDVHDSLVYGVELSWFPDSIPVNARIWEKIKDFFIYHYNYGIFICFLIVLVLLAKFVFGSPFVIALLIYKWRRRHLSMFDRIEEFLQSYHNLVPIRYSYSEIKKMTKGFNEKLGEGGYGSVYKGKLRSNRLVAIKMLGGSKGNGEDFINEVATIGRIHHVNVVQLIGFCVEGPKRALVFDYMPKGSLDKHIFCGEGVDKHSFSSNKMFEISLGVARGIEYLHKGCGIQILHFDIKPHNILLDDNFAPKVSDFGLARLCPLDHNTVTLTAARGTLGYIAPELFYKNIGGVSYKADVYSFGMLLMEMASRRKNTVNSAADSSKVHFPTWVSNQFCEGNDIDLGVTKDHEESRLIKKMMIVALWCIQFKPCDRPSMSKVVEMLEEKSEILQMPPAKFSFYPQAEVREEIEGESSSSDWLSYSSSSIQSRDS